MWVRPVQGVSKKFQDWCISYEIWVSPFNVITLDYRMFLHLVLSISFASGCQAMSRGSYADTNEARLVRECHDWWWVKINFKCAAFSGLNRLTLKRPKRARKSKSKVLLMAFFHCQFFPQCQMFNEARLQRDPVAFVFFQCARWISAWKVKDASPCQCAPDHDVQSICPFKANKKMQGQPPSPYLLALCDSPPPAQECYRLSIQTWRTL